jgi:L-threo-3-deoxy-hexylosonate aldolase
MSLNGTVNGNHPISRPLKPGVLAPIPTFFLKDSEDLGRVLAPLPSRQELIVNACFH